METKRRSVKMTLRIIKYILMPEVLHFPIAISGGAVMQLRDLPLQRIKTT